MGYPSWMLLLAFILIKSIIYLLEIVNLWYNKNKGDNKMNISFGIIVLLIGIACSFCAIDDLKNRILTWRLVNIITGPFNIYYVLFIKFAHVL